MWGRHCCSTSFFPIVNMCLSCEDLVQQSCAMVPRWRIFGNFLRLAFPASSVQHIWDHHHHKRFMALFPGPPGWASARRKLLDFMVQGKINKSRYTDHTAERHSMRTNQCPPPPSPIFSQAGRPSCRPTNSVNALKATSAFGLGRRR